MKIPLVPSTDSWSASPLTWLFEMAFTMNMAIEEATVTMMYTWRIKTNINVESVKHLFTV